MRGGNAGADHGSSAIEKGWWKGVAMGREGKE